MRIHPIKALSTVAAICAVSIVLFFGCGSKGVANQTAADDMGFETSDKVDENTFLIYGTLKGEKSANQLIFIQELRDKQLVFVDTVRTDSKGKYSFAGHSAVDKFYYITIQTNRPPGVPVLVKNNEKIMLNLTPGNLIATEVKANEANMQLKELYDLYQNHNRLSNEFQEKVQGINPREISDSARKALDAEFAAINSRVQSELTAFINDKKGGPATYFAVMYVLQEPNPTQMESALAKMKESIPDHAFTLELESFIEMNKPIEMGGYAPDIRLQNPQGEVVALSSLRGKVVLIDFWASWCRPCRVENPNVVKMYKRYHDQGFEVYSVSLDDKKANWEAAIQADGLTWTHVSDLRGWQSSAAQLYKVHSIPATFLLDREGKIIGMNLRGPALEERLAKMFK